MESRAVFFFVAQISFDSVKTQLSDLMMFRFGMSNQVVG